MAISASARITVERVEHRARWRGWVGDVEVTAGYARTQRGAERRARRGLRRFMRTGEIRLSTPDSRVINLTELAAPPTPPVRAARPAAQSVEDAPAPAGEGTDAGT